MTNLGLLPLSQSYGRLLNQPESPIHFSLNLIFYASSEYKQINVCSLFRGGTPKLQEFNVGLLFETFRQILILKTDQETLSLSAKDVFSIEFNGYLLGPRFLFHLLTTHRQLDFAQKCQSQEIFRRPLTILSRKKYFIPIGWIEDQDNIKSVYKQFININKKGDLR